MARRTVWIAGRTLQLPLAIAAESSLAVISPSTVVTNTDLAGGTVIRTLLDLEVHNDSGSLFSVLTYGMLLVPEELPGTTDMSIGTEGRGWLMSGQLAAQPVPALTLNNVNHRIESRAKRKLGSGNNDLRFYFANDPGSGDGLLITAMWSVLIMMP